MTDVFRKEPWAPLDELTKSKIAKIKNIAQELLDEINAFPMAGEALRHRALAQTNLEQAVMWAVKAVT